jgi:hypothetical protein
VLVDRELVVRVERAMARHTALEVDAFAEQHPQSGAHWRELGGGVLAALGEGRYVNRGVGVGLEPWPPQHLLDELEAFFRADGLPPSLEVSPWAMGGLADELRIRGYVVQWFRNVYAHDLLDLPPPRTTTIAEVDERLETQWSAVLGGASPVDSAARTTSDEFCAAVHHVPGAVDLVAIVDDQAAAAGSVTFVDGLALFGGAATLEAHRRSGLQRDLLAHRLHLSVARGAGMAVVTAMADGASARNLLRVGFQLLYTQAVMTRP